VGLVTPLQLVINETDLMSILRILEPGSIDRELDPMGRKKTKTPEQNLARVRDNQRRHRAKIRDYVQELEQKLAENQALLAEAESKVFELTAALELERLRAEKTQSLCQSSEFCSSHQAEVPLPDGPTQSMELRINVSDAYPSHARKRCCASDCPLMDQCALCTPQASHTKTAVSSHNIEQSPAGNCPKSASFTETLELAKEQCLDLKPPQHSESTTLCITAYSLIDQQNFRGIETATIYQWLRQGFRSGCDTQDGCRVENNTLFSLLDFLSST